MDWEAFEKHKPFAGEKKPSMLRRRIGHDYESRCIYLVTMVVEGRRPLLGRLVGRADAEEDSPEAPRVELTALGEEVRRCWQAIGLYHPEVRVLATMVMPDHLHGILFVERQMEQPLGMVLRGFKTGCNKAYRQFSMPQHCCGKANKETRGFLFSRNYNDHILEGEGELARWFAYLKDNPRRLAVKRQRPDFFTVMQHRQLGEWSCQMVGNSSLLVYPEKSAVIVHGATSDQKFQEMKEAWLAMAARGGVLVSATIATREKEVMCEAMNRGYRLIALRENGFPPLYKPAGESFDACSDGRLLQVSPWEHHNERRTISREQCLQLNRLAEYIASM